MLGFSRRKGRVMCDGRLSHIAFIMDGNGRWAKRRGLPREAGHVEGSRNLERILRACLDRGIMTVTVYACSTENWRRPEKEVSAIMGLLTSYLKRAREEQDKNKVHVRVLGDISVFEGEVQESIRLLDAETAHYPHTLNIALNYGARQELVTAVNRLLAEGREQVTEQDISEALYTAGQKDPDLIVRTSGECRTSNFLLWQSAYAEYAFVKTPWPAFGEKELDGVLRDFYQRHRRFGGL